MAGLWTVNTRVEDEPLATCTILTCDSRSNRVIAPVHDRMPVILADPEQWRAWLDTEVTADEALSMCGPLSAERMTVRPLPQAFNDARNKTREVLFAEPAR
jgi:putative SOS response-associated peptidase YedK